ncbi:MAG: hypothetical protein AAGA48_28750 [Myxococcota bacterium]
MAQSATSRQRKRSSGRKSKLTAALRRKFCAALEQGATYKAACGFVGIDYSTFRRWMVKGEASESGIQREFRDAVLAAESAGENVYVSVVHNIAVGLPAAGANADDDASAPKATDSLKAASWMLERRYGWTQRTEVTGKDGAPLQVEAKTEVITRPMFADEQIEAMTPEQLQAAIAARYGTAAEAK